MRLIAPLFLALILIYNLIGCAQNSDGFYVGSLGIQSGRIYVVHGISATVTTGISVYDLNGKFLGILNETYASGMRPRGLALGGDTNLIVSVDTPDKLFSLDLITGALTTFVEDSLLSGNIYDIKYLIDSYFVIESNNIERYTSAGSRIPAAGNSYITPTVGACVSSGSRGLTSSQSGYLVAASLGNDRINVYDVSNPSSASCVAAYTGFAATVNPQDVYGHSNGNLYIVGNGDHAIYETNEDFSSGVNQIYLDTTIINRPTAIAEHPDGSLLIASDTTDSVVKLSTSGVVENASFIKSSVTAGILDIIVIP